MKKNNKKIREEAMRMFLTGECDTNAEIACKLDVKPHTIGRWRKEEDWDKIMNIHSKGVWLGMKYAIPEMKKTGGGKIVNMGSSSGIHGMDLGLCAYSAAKAGVLGLTRDLALELAPFQICVNAILPGLIPTDMYDHLEIFPPGVNKEDVFIELGKTIAPMQRAGTPEDIAGAALFLASELSAYVTGDRILVGGGYPLKKSI